MYPRPLPVWGRGPSRRQQGSVATFARGYMRYLSKSTCVDKWRCRVIYWAGQQGSTAIMSTPDYLRVADAIRSQITEGLLRPGDKLPSNRALAAEHDVSMGTVNQAMIVLKTERYVEGRQGKGVFVLPASARA